MADTPRCRAVREVVARDGADCERAVCIGDDCDGAGVTFGTLAGALVPVQAPATTVTTVTTSRLYRELNVRFIIIAPPSVAATRAEIPPG